MKAPTQAPITADKGITDLAPDREAVSLGVWDGVWMVKVELKTRLILGWEPVVRTVISEPSIWRQTLVQDLEYLYSMGRVQYGFQ